MLRLSLIVIAGLLGMANAEPRRSGASINHQESSVSTRQQGKPLDSGLPIDACLVGRPGLQETRPGEVDLVFVPPANFDLKKCRAQLKPKSFKGETCLTSLGFCRVRAVNGGINRLRTPIDVEFSCINQMDPEVVRMKACESGISPDQVQESDIRCGSNQEDL